MANGFSKEERVMFEEILAGYEDTLDVSNHVKKYGTNGELMERSNDTFWRPMPYIMISKDRVIGTDVTTDDVKQLSVPSTLGFKKVVPWKLSATEMRDKMQEGQLQKAASERLDTDINLAIRDVICDQGSLAVPISGAAGTYDDIALAESLMDELGIMGERKMGLGSRDYNGMAGNLASRTLMPKSAEAYSKSYIGEVANFDLFKTSKGKAIGANSATVTIDTTGSQVRYVPLAAESSTAGEINVDNRYQTLTVSTTTGVTAGDYFTIAGIEALHHQEKESTGQLKTFKVVSVDSGTTMTVSPPIIGANSTPTNPEKMYQNVEVASTSATAAITFLNDTASHLNPFWYRDSIELLLGRYNVPTDQGPAVMKGTTKQGVEIVLTKEFTGKGYESEYFLDNFFGTVNLNPEMNGCIFWGQA